MQNANEQIGFNVQRVYLDRVNAKNAPQLTVQVYDKATKTRSFKLKGASYNPVHNCYQFNQTMMSMGVTLTTLHQTKIGIKIIHEGRVSNTTLAKGEIRVPSNISSNLPIETELRDKRGEMHVGRAVVVVTSPTIVVEANGFTRLNTAVTVNPGSIHATVLTGSLHSDRPMAPLAAQSPPSVQGSASVYSGASSATDGSAASRTTAYGQLAHRMTMPVQLHGNRPTPAPHDSRQSVHSERTVTSPLSEKSTGSDYPLSPTADPPKFGSTQHMTFEQHNSGHARLTQHSSLPAPVTQASVEDRYPNIDYLKRQRHSATQLYSQQ